jgi:hypothetical protein
MLIMVLKPEVSDTTGDAMKRYSSLQKNSTYKNVSAASFIKE